MKRITFIKRILGLVGITAVVPAALVSMKEPHYVSPHRYFIGLDPVTGEDRTAIFIDESTLPNGMTAEKIIKKYNNTDVLYFDRSKEMLNG